DSVIAGVLIGLVVPFVSYALLLSINDFGVNNPLHIGILDDFYGMQAKGLSVMAICVNLLPFNLMKKQRFDDGMRGLVIATSIYVFAWMIMFGLPLIGIHF
ncbi:MAG: hypothetical protein RI894_1975, partial [Bacteroidota bacterium]